MKSSKDTKTKSQSNDSNAKKKTSAVRKTAAALKSAVKKTVARKKSAAKPADVKTVTKITAKEQQQVSQLEEVTKSKFRIQHEDAKEIFSEHPSQLPDFYGEDKVILLVRDPYWLYAYWEITDQAVNDVRVKSGDKSIGRANIVLRVKDITGTNPNKPASSFDIHVADGSSSWYINVSADNRDYCVEIGILTSDGRFFMVSRSNSVTAPRAGVSDVYDEKWMSLEEYDRVYGLSGGLNIKGMSSADIRKQMAKKFEAVLSSGALSSGVLSSGELVGKSKKARDFFLVVDAELIVYGRTVPSAKLTIQGKPKSLNPDGTFSARFSLPMAVRQEIPVTAVSSDGVDKLTITPVVSREENK